MRKILLFCAVLLSSAILSLIFSASIIRAKESQVPVELAKRAAISFAEDVFEKTVVGPSEIYYGLDNKPAVYVFPLSLKATTFPDEQQILNEVAEGEKTFDRGKELRDENLIKAGKQKMVGEGKYGMIMVSARYEMGPIIEYYKALPLHYTAREKAKEMAEKELGTKDIELKRYIFYSPFDIWFEFISSEKLIYVSPFTFKTFTKDQIFTVPPLEISKERSEKATQDWRRIERGEKLYPTLTRFRIPGVPDFDWSYGCSPSAAADILGYWQANGFPLLIDYYFWRWDLIEGEWDYIPNVQQQLAIAMHTDSTTGSTSISSICPGIEAVCNSPDWDNNYVFVCQDSGDNWSKLISEINAYRPVHWGLQNHPTYGNHAACAMGWGPPDSEWICIHDTWSTTPEEVVIDYDNWGGPRYVRIVDPRLFTEFDQFGETGNSKGVAWGDYDKDGDLDLAVTNDGQNKLYRNDGENHFTEFDQFGSYSYGLAWGDYDNDGDLDLAVANVGHNKLYRNNGDGSFQEAVTFSSNLYSSGIAWGDYNNDGFIDLAVANMDGQDELYRNNGDGSFTEFSEFNPYASSGIAWGDYDDDGDLDVATAGWGANGKLYRNNGDGTFSEALAFESGGCFGVAWGDYNNDGHLDIGFSGWSPFGILKVFKNNGDGTFSEIILNYDRNKGIAWGDFENDGDLDLAVGKHGETENKLYRNDGNDSFTGFDQFGPGPSEGIAWGDYDNDGDLDLAVAKSGQNKLYRNNRNGIDWIKVKVIGGKRGVGTQGSNRAGIGAKVKVYNQNKQQLLGYREISAGSGYCSMDALEAHLGVPPQGNTYHVEVYWPTSGITTDTLVTAPAVITVWEFCRGDANGDKVVNSVDITFLINYLFGGYSPPDPWMAGDANADGDVNVTDVVCLINYLYSGGSPPPPPTCP